MKRLTKLLGSLAVIAALAGAGYYYRNEIRSEYFQIKNQLRDKLKEEKNEFSEYNTYVGEISGWKVRIDESKKGASRKLTVHLDAIAKETVPYAITGQDSDGLGKNLDDWETIAIRKKPNYGYNEAKFKPDGTWDFKPCSADEERVQDYTKDEIDQAKFLLKRAVEDVYRSHNKKDYFRERKDDEIEQKRAVLEKRLDSLEKKVEAIAPKTEIKPETKTEAKPEPKYQTPPTITKPEAKTESKYDTKPETKLEQPKSVEEKIKPPTIPEIKPPVLEGPRFVPQTEQKPDNLPEQNILPNPEYAPKEESKPKTQLKWLKPGLPRLPFPKVENLNKENYPKACEQAK